MKAKLIATIVAIFLTACGGGHDDDAPTAKVVAAPPAGCFYITASDGARILVCCDPKTGLCR